MSNKSKGRKAQGNRGQKKLAGFLVVQVPLVPKALTELDQLRNEVVENGADPETLAKIDAMRERYLTERTALLQQLDDAVEAAGGLMVT